MPIISGGGGDGSGGGTQTLLATITLGADGIIDFTGIAQTYNDLVIVAVVRGTRAATSDNLGVRLNGDATAANYDWQLFTLSGVAVGGGFVANDSVPQVGPIPGSTATANYFATATIEICGYASTTWSKVCRSTLSGPVTAATTTYVAEASGLYKPTTAVSQVTLRGYTTANLLTGSTARLYGRL